jgi:arginase family enzyme
MRAEPCRKSFGVALDASDDPVSLDLKKASMLASAPVDNGSDSDPYDKIASKLQSNHGISPAGKFPVPSWLGPRPTPADETLVTLENFERFYRDKGFWRATIAIREYVEKSIFPDIPVMIGIDHSATGGVLAAISSRYGADQLSVVVLDRHFDGIAPSTRLAEEQMPFAAVDEAEYCCGSFWSYLLDRNVVLPENLLFVGVADYPDRNRMDEWNVFQQRYGEFEERGCRFFPLAEFETPYVDRLKQRVDECITTPYVYVSLDVDVGSYESVHAARYMDGPGLSRDQLYDAARIIAGSIREKGASLAGFDVMEFNTHFLGIETASGLKDQTLTAVDEFVDGLLAVEGN